MDSNRDVVNWEIAAKLMMRSRGGGALVKFEKLT